VEKVLFEQEELIWLAKVLDQRRLFLKYTLRTSLSKDHTSIKNKILSGINEMVDQYLIVAPKREFVYLCHALTQYFIMSYRAGIFDNERKFLKTLKSITVSINEDFEDILSGLFE